MIIQCEYQDFQICSNTACVTGCKRKSNHHMAITPTYTPQGCICPPTSEKTCESPTCPRRPASFTTSAKAVWNKQDQQP